MTISRGLSLSLPSTKKSAIIQIKRNSKIRIAQGASSPSGLSSPQRLVSRMATGFPIMSKLFMVMMMMILFLLKNIALCTLGVQNISFVHRGWNFESLAAEVGGEVRNKIDILRHRVTLFCSLCNICLIFQSRMSKI